MTPKEGSQPVDTAVIVEAPMTLAGGYRLDVEHNGRVFPVAVPEGGVNQGETFQVALPLPEPSAPPPDEENLLVVPDNFVSPEVQFETVISKTTKSVIHNPDGTQTIAEETVYPDGTVVTSVTQSIAEAGLLQVSMQSSKQQAAAQRQVAYADIPLGPWRYPLCDCCKVRRKGMLWMACCCTFIPMGQVSMFYEVFVKIVVLLSLRLISSKCMNELVELICMFLIQIMQRLKLKPNGTPGIFEHTCSIWTCLWILLIFCFIMSIVWNPMVLCAFFAVLLYAIYALTKARYHMRQKYRIPPRCCKSRTCNRGCDDCCCAFWCMPCVICQMMTHTHDDNEYNYKCFSRTGLDKDAPDIE